MVLEILKIAFLISFNAIYGYFEFNLFSRGFHPGRNDIFGLISSSYHLPMLLWLGTPAVILGYFYLIPVLLIVEDQSYFMLENRTAAIDQDDWIAQMMGFQVWFGRVIPNAYFALFMASMILSIVFFVVS